MTQTFNPSEHLMQIKNRDGATDYLPVQWRLVWFREQCPQGTIDTEELEVDIEREITKEVYAWNNEKRRSEKVMKTATGYARYKAIVTDGKGGRACGTKSECAVDFPDFAEKAETGAIGRALAGLGYGTQFAPDLDEGRRIVDSPVERPEPATSGTSQPPRPQTTQPAGQTPAVLNMIARAKSRAESLQLLWDSVKRDTFAGRCPEDSTLTVQQVAQINGVLTVIEKGPVSA